MVAQVKEGYSLTDIATLNNVSKQLLAYHCEKAKVRVKSPKAKQTARLKVLKKLFDSSSKSDNL